MIVGCSLGPEDETIHLRDNDAPLSPEHDHFVSLDEEALAEQFDPDRLYVDASDSVAAAVVSGAKALAKGYADAQNPQVRATQVQRLVRDAIEADVLVVAEVVDKQQQAREGHDGEALPWTVVQFDVRATLTVDTPIDDFTLEKLGGTVGSATYHTCGMPDFAVGGKYLVALYRHAATDNVFLLNEQSSWPIAEDTIVGLGFTIAEVAAELEVLK